MKFGLSYNTGYYGTDPDQMTGVARHAEQCGFESFYVPEHIALYPGATLGPAAIPPSLPIADPLECLSFVAAATAGRDAGALEYTRWGSIDMTEADVADVAAKGTTRLAVAPASAEESEQRDQISAFAERLNLR